MFATSSGKAAAGCGPVGWPAARWCDALACQKHRSAGLHAQVLEAERRLRGALLLDGLQPGEGYALARYNDPFTLPLFRRNEVLIALKEFELDE